MFLSSPCETSSNGIHLNTRRVIRELIAHLMVELPINKIKKKQENLAIFQSLSCETSGNGIHLKTSEGTDWSHDSSNLRSLIAKKNLRGFGMTHWSHCGQFE